MCLDKNSATDWTTDSPSSDELDLKYLIITDTNTILPSKFQFFVSGSLPEPHPPAMWSARQTFPPDILPQNSSSGSLATWQ